MKQPTSNSTRLVWWALSIGWTTLIVVLSLVSVPPPKMQTFIDLDKLVHFFAYGIMSYLAGCAIGGSRPGLSRASIIFICMFWGAGVGLALELIQSQVGRQFSWFDEIANVLGAAAGAWLFTSGCLVRLWSKLFGRGKR